MPMRVPSRARVMLAQVMVFAAITLAAPSAVLSVTGTGTAMCGATGAPTMGPSFPQAPAVGESANAGETLAAERLHQARHDRERNVPSHRRRGDRMSVHF